MSKFISAESVFALFSAPDGSVVCTPLFPRSGGQLLGIAVGMDFHSAVEVNDAIRDFALDLGFDDLTAGNVIAEEVYNHDLSSAGFLLRAAGQPR